MITGLVGIAICPWWLMNSIIPALVFISGLLGPVLGILICDYFVIRKKKVALAELYKTKGAYSYTLGFNMASMVALATGVLAAIIGFWVPVLVPLYKMSWFTGFFVAFVVYYFMMRSKAEVSEA